MRVLIDECIDPRVKFLFIGHEVKTVHEMGWDRIQDGPLLRLAEQHFEVFVTLDRSLKFQQNLQKLALGIVEVSVPKNQLRAYPAVRDRLIAAVEAAGPGKIVHVNA
jgi:hypothetical protein